MKKFISVFLAVLLVLCHVTAFADDTVYTEGTLYYTIDDGSITITGCFGKDESVEIPSQIAGVPVNTIAGGAFTDNEYIKEVTLPDTITAIEEGAFDGSITVLQRQGGSTDDTEESSEPTAAPESTSTPKSTSSPQSTSTPKSTSSPQSTATASPTAKPSSTATPAPTSSSSTSTATVTSGTSSKTIIIQSATVSVDGGSAAADEADVYLEEDDIEDFTVEADSVQPSDTPATDSEDDISTATEDKSSSAAPFIIGGVILVAAAVAAYIYIKKRKN